MTNSGTLSATTTIKGDLTHSGTSSALLVFNGNSTQSINSTAPLGSLTIQNNINVTGDLDILNLTTYSGSTLSLSTGNDLDVSGNITNNGTISGGDMTLDGGTQYLYGTGSLDVDNLTFGGTGAKTVRDNKTIDGDLIVNSGVTLVPYGGRATYFIYVKGDITNNGSVTYTGGYNYGRIYLFIYGDLDNNGTMTNYATYAAWDDTGADSYDFQYTDTSDVWQTEVSTGTNTFYNITAWEDDDRRWRWREVNDGTPSDWSSDKYIN